MREGGRRVPFKPKSVTHTARTDVYCTCGCGGCINGCVVVAGGESCVALGIGDSVVVVMMFALLAIVK